jgi:hypothetical protein
MGLFFAWAVGEGIIVYRWIKNGAPPTPGALALPAALYLGLAVIGEYAPAKSTVTLFAWAVDLAIALQVVGKDPKETTGWPPPAIPAGVFLPGGTAAAASTTSTAAPAAAPSSGASGGSGVQLA